MTEQGNEGAQCVVVIPFHLISTLGLIVILFGISTTIIIVGRVRWREWQCSGRALSVRGSLHLSLEVTTQMIGSLPPPPVTA